MPVSSFTNPTTSTMYRLVVEPGGWRITKSTREGDRLRLLHLRGPAGTEPIDAAAVARLVAGEGGLVSRPTDGMAAFIAVVLQDVSCTADVLTAVAREAQVVYDTGCRGFRPRSPALRRQRDAATARVVAECRLMTEAWRMSGLQAEQLPTWLEAALGDGETHSPPR